jgi:mRNA interferase RelE/StbE
MFDIQYRKAAEKFLARQESRNCLRIKTAIEKLPSGDVKKLRGSDGDYRLRVGDFRIKFHTDGNILFVDEIDNRGDAYK